MRVPVARGHEYRGPGGSGAGRPDAALCGYEDGSGGWDRSTGLVRQRRRPGFDHGFRRGASASGEGGRRSTGGDAADAARFAAASVAENRELPRRPGWVRAEIPGVRDSAGECDRGTAGGVRAGGERISARRVGHGVQSQRFKAGEYPLRRRARLAGGLGGRVSE